MKDLHVTALYKQFPGDVGTLAVLEDITVHVRPGEIVAIVGKSGSGKSTLLNIIGGLEEPTSGTVTCQGTLGYIPQADTLLPWRTVLENILLPIEIQAGDLEAAVTKARYLLAKNGLAEFAGSYPDEISGGMRQKASLIRTLVQDPDIVLFDECFSAIDFAARLQLVKEVRSYIVSAQKSAIFVTHNIEEAIAVSDRLLVISGRPARIVYAADITLDEAYRDPVNVRKSQHFQTLFEDVWKLQRTSV